MNWTMDCAYDEAHKQRFHTTARARLRQLAAMLQLSLARYDLQTNKAGIAVSGDVTLHHECVYIQVSQSALGGGMGILIRTCRGRRDYTGGSNNWAPLALLDDISALAAKVRTVVPGLCSPVAGVRGRARRCAS